VNLAKSEDKARPLLRSSLSKVSFSRIVVMTPVTITRITTKLSINNVNLVLKLNVISCGKSFMRKTFLLEFFHKFFYSAFFAPISILMPS
jgi:hypothetical protein